MLKKRKNSSNYKLLFAATALVIMVGILAYAKSQSFTVTELTKDGGLSNRPSKPSIAYKNTQYGFTITLPKSWDGYTMIDDQWTGSKPDHPEFTSGPIVRFRHPQWTSAVPRQDIPVMVITRDQWNALQKDEFHIGAAPINPTELARNDKYVFALPARYNYTFPVGYEEVDAIMNSGAVKAF